MGSRALLVLAVVALAAFAVFAWLQNAPAGDAEVVDARPEVARPVPAESAQLSAPRPTASDTDEKPRQVVSADLDPVIESAGSRDHSELASGPRITGLVVDREGQPVAGARVFASNNTSMAIDYPEGEGPRWLRRTLARTDADGRFELDGPLPGRMRIVVRASGFAPYDRAPIAVPADDDLELEPIVIAPGAILSGRVVDAQGSGVGGARISSLEQGGRTFFLGTEQHPTLAETEPDGSFRIDELPNGSWKLLASHDLHPAATAAGMAERPGEEVGNILMQFGQAATIAGTVQGVPATERDIVVRASEAGAGFGMERMLGTRIAPVQRDGSFELVGLHAGRDYELQVRRASSELSGFFFGGSRSRRTKARAGERGVLLLFQPAASVAFQVHDAKTGLPLEGFMVSAGVDWTRPILDADNRPILEHPEGRVVVDDLRPADDDDRVQVHIKATGYEEWKRNDLVVSLGETLELGKIFLDPKPVVRVTVLDAATDRPIEGASVALSKMPEPLDTGGGMQSRSFRISADVDVGDLGGVLGPDSGGERTDEKGIAVLNSLEGELAQIVVRADGYAPERVNDLYLPPGELVDQVIRIGRGGNVSITVLDAEGYAVAGARVEHRSPAEIASQLHTMSFGMPGGRQVTDSDGKLVFANLEPGVHEFKLGKAAGPGGFMMDGGGQASIQMVDQGGVNEDLWSRVEVVLDETAELVLQSAPEGTVAGRILEAGRPLVGATLKLRDKDDSQSPGFSLPGMPSGPEARTDGEGAYEFVGVETGDYVLSIEHATRSMPTEFDLEVDAGENDFNANLGVSILAGRITDEEGEALQDVRVSLQRHAGEGQPMVRTAFVMVTDGGDVSASSGPSMGEAVYTDSDGRYELRGVATDVELVVKAEGDMVQPGESRPVRVGPDDVIDGVDIQMEAGGSIEVEALLSDGAPARFCVVRARYEGDERGVEPKVGFIRSGSTTLKGLRPGPWRVSVTGGGNLGGLDDEEPLEQTVEVKKLETREVSFTLD